MSKAITSKYDASGRMILDNAGGRISVPGSLAVDSGTSGPIAVLTGNSISSLGAGPFEDGQIAVIRVGTWPDLVEVLLKWNQAANKWVGEFFPLLAPIDQHYSGVNTATYSYPSTSDGASTTTAYGYLTKPVPHAADLFAAGLKLQTRMNGFVHGNSTPSAITVQSFWYQHDNGDAVAFDTNGAGAIGQGTPVVSPASLSVVYEAAGWDYVFKNGTSTPLSSADVVKQNLWPRLYAKVGTAGSYGGLLMSVEARWAT